jgi:glycosyltransferase involved in cell wall biosynthesis
MSGTPPRISIVTPSFNQREFIGQTIESVLDQQYPDLELIVMDGGSTDGTVALLESYGDRLAFVSEADRGQSHALNKGMTRATGDVLAFLNSDDFYEPGALRTAGDFFASHPASVWLTGLCRTVDRDGREIRRPITAYKNAWLRHGGYRALQVLNYVSQPATFWRRELFEAVGEFDESLSYAMDYDYWLRAGRLFKLDVVDRYLACFRVHETSKAGSSARAQFDSAELIASRHVGSRALLGAHRAHNAVSVAAYRILLPRERQRASRAL